MGIYIVKKTFFYSNEVGGTLRGTRQGPVLKYLISTTGRSFVFLAPKERTVWNVIPENAWFQLLLDICILIKIYMYSQTCPSVNLY